MRLHLPPFAVLLVSFATQLGVAQVTELEFLKEPIVLPTQPTEADFAFDRADAELDVQSESDVTTETPLTEITFPESKPPAKEESVTKLTTVEAGPRESESEDTSAQAPNAGIETNPPVADNAEKNPASMDFKFSLQPVELQLSDELSDASELYRQGKWREAVVALDEYASNNPSSPRLTDALFLMAESTMQLQEHDSARQLFRRLLQRKPNASQTAHARFRIAESTMLLNERSQAREMLEQFQTDYPDHELNAYAIPYLAETVGLTGDSARARELYEAGLAAYPDGPLNRESRFRLGMLAYTDNDFAKAAQFFADTIARQPQQNKRLWTAKFWKAMAESRTGDSQRALAGFLQLVDSNPEHELSESALFYAARILDQLGRHDRAASAYRRLRTEWPDGEFAEQTRLLELRALASAGDHDAMITAYERIRQRTDDQRQRDAATRIVVESMIAKEQYDEAAELIGPLALKRRSLLSKQAREDHYTNLFLLALAERGLGNSGRAGQLLRRIRLAELSPEVAQRVQLARIESFNAGGEYAAAIQVGFDYENQFPQGETRDAVRTEMIRGLLKSNRFDEASIKFRQLQSDDGLSKEIARAARLIAEAAYAAGDYGPAADAFILLESSSQDPSDQAQASSGLAWIALKRGQRSEGERRFRDLVARFPEHQRSGEFRLALGQLLAGAGKFREAIEVYSFYEHEEVANSSRARALYQLADLLKKAPANEGGSPEKANDIADRLIAEYPKFEARDAALYLSGLVKRTLDDPAAKERFDAVVNQHRTSKFWSDSLYRLAELASRSEERDEAKAYLTRLISVGRDRKVVPHAIYLKGRLETSERNWDGARETLRDILRKYPDSELVPVARYGVAESFYQQKFHDRALELFNILDANARFSGSDSWGAMIQLRRAQLLVAKKRSVEAIEVAQQIESDFPGFSLQGEVDYLLARAHATRGEFTKAREYYGKVIESSSNRDKEIVAMAGWMTGETYFHQKKYILAIKSYEVLIADTQYAKWQAASYLQIGKCYEKLGNTEMARKAYSRVVKRFGDSDSADEAKYRLSVVDES